MPTIYLDHMIAHYFVREFPPSHQDEPAALARAMTDPSVQFVVSDWNFVEPCWESDGGSPLALIDRYADFFESLNPIFLSNAVVIKNAEMAALVYTRLGMESTFTVPVFNKVFTQASIGLGVTLPAVGYTLRHFMRHLLQHPQDLKAYDTAKQDVLKAQLTIKDAKASGKYENKLNKQKTIRHWFQSMMPERDAAGKWITNPAARTAVLGEFVADPATVYSACPAIHAEHLAAEARASKNGGGRNPTLSDGMDLMFLVPTLAYCDALVTRDSFVIDCSRYVIRQSRRKVVVEKSLRATLDALGIP